MEQALVPMMLWLVVALDPALLHARPRCLGCAVASIWMVAAELPVEDFHRHHHHLDGFQNLTRLKLMMMMSQARKRRRMKKNVIPSWQVQAGAHIECVACLLWAEAVSVACEIDIAAMQTDLLPHLILVELTQAALNLGLAGTQRQRH